MCVLLAIKPDCFEALKLHFMNSLCKIRTTGLIPYLTQFTKTKMFLIIPFCSISLTVSNNVLGAKFRKMLLCMFLIYPICKSFLKTLKIQIHKLIYHLYLQLLFQVVNVINQQYL